MTPHMLPPQDTKGKTPHKIPKAEEKCLNSEQAEEVYECVEKNIPLSNGSGKVDLGFEREIEETERKEIETEKKEIEKKDSEVKAQEDVADAQATPELRPEYQILDQLPQTFPQQIEEEVEEFETSSLRAKWSIFSTNPLYLQTTENSGNVHFKQPDFDSFCIKTASKNLRVNLKKKPKITPAEYLDRFDAVEPVTQDEKSPVYSEDTSVSLTYLGRSNTDWSKEFEIEPSFKINQRCVTESKLLDGTKMELFVDSGATRCYLSETFFRKHKQLHSLPRFKTRTKGLKQGGEGAPLIPARFLIPITFTVQGHKFEVFALAVKIEPTHDLVLGIQNLLRLKENSVQDKVKSDG